MLLFSSEQTLKQMFGIHNNHHTNHLSFVPPGSLQGEHQRRLYKELLANYNRLERPVANDSAAILVELGLTLLQIIDVVRKWHSFVFTCMHLFVFIALSLGNV